MGVQVAWAPVAPNRAWSHAQPPPEMVRKTPEQCNADNQEIYNASRQVARAKKEELKRARDANMRAMVSANLKVDVHSTFTPGTLL